MIEHVYIVFPPVLRSLAHFQNFEHSLCTRYIVHNLYFAVRDAMAVATVTFGQRNDSLAAEIIQFSWEANQ